jgi:hypothetical protein
VAVRAFFDFFGAAGATAGATSVDSGAIAKADAAGSDATGADSSARAVSGDTGAVAAAVTGAAAVAGAGAAAGVVAVAVTGAGAGAAAWAGTGACGFVTTIGGGSAATACFAAAERVFSRAAAATEAGVGCFWPVFAAGAGGATGTAVCTTRAGAASTGAAA